MPFWGKSVFNQNHIHEFQPVAANPGTSTTWVLYRCKCGELKPKVIDGFWTIEQIQNKIPNA